MESKHILSVERFKELARPTSKHIDEGDVMTFVRECEEIKIIPAIGLERFKEMINAPEDSRNKILLEGGEYNDKCGKLKRCVGLQTTVAYFVYAHMVMVDGGMLTRTGLMQHNDSYASRENDKNRVRLYDDAMNAAETYLSSCLAYIKAIEKENINPVRGTRIRFHAIGD